MKGELNSTLARELTDAELVAIDKIEEIIEKSFGRGIYKLTVSADKNDPTEPFGFVIGLKKKAI
jgi:hypothetical protein